VTSSSDRHRRAISLQASQRCIRAAAAGQESAAFAAIRRTCPSRRSDMNEMERGLRCMHADMREQSREESFTSGSGIASIQSALYS
jgi:hypothetical protein